jgi:REP-associated tyrosine transposase
MTLVRARLQPCRPMVGRSAALAAEGMSIPSRHHSRVGTYFVTSRTSQSQMLFAADSYAIVFTDSLMHYRQGGAYALHAFVLMPDHFHILLTPALDKSLERAVQYIKGGSARKLALEQNMRFPVWQRGFSDHRIRDAADYAAHLRYIWQNPVRKKLVLEPQQFRWSSASGVFVLDPPPQGLKPQEKEERPILRHG